jgi:hypothetical protein
MDNKAIKKSQEVKRFYIKQLTSFKLCILPQKTTKIYH